MHAILGMAAAHLAAIGSVARDSCQQKRFQKTELYHWHHAIRLYRQQLDRDSVVGQADALITTCMLLGIHSLYLQSADNIR